MVRSLFLSALLFCTAPLCAEPNIYTELESLRSRVDALEKAATPTPSPTPEPTPEPEPPTEPAPPAPSDNMPPEPADISKAVKLDRPIILDKPNTTYVLHESYVIDGTAIYVAAMDVKIDLNGHSIFYGKNNAPNAHAVHLYIGWGADADLKLPIKNSLPAMRTTITNGCLIHAGTGDESHAIYGQRGGDAKISRIYASVNGADSATVRFMSDWDRTDRCVSIVDSILVSNAKRTNNRDMGPSNVWLNEHIDGKCSIGNCAILGGNSGIRAGSESVIAGNVICQKAHATNSYAVWLYRNRDIQVTDNLCIPAEGRGVLLNSGSDHVVSGNAILALNKGNAEFGDGLNAACIRMRYDAARNKVIGNHCLAVGGHPWTAGSALYLSNWNDVADAEPNDISGNRFAAVMVRTLKDEVHYAKAVTLEHQETADKIAKNYFAGNDYLLSTSGPDGGSEGVIISDSTFHGMPAHECFAAFNEFAGNVMERIPIAIHPVVHGAVIDNLAQVKKAIQTAPPVSKQPIYAGHWKSTSDDVDLKDCGGQVFGPEHVYLHDGETSVVIAIRNGGKEYRLINRNGIERFDW